MYKSAFICVMAGLSLLMRTGTSLGDSADARQAITRALPHVEQQGRWWIEEKKCVSCHRVTFMTWALSAAERKGFALDRAQLEQWRAWSRDKLLGSPKADAPPVGTTNLEGVSQLLLAEQTPRQSLIDEPTQNRLVSFLTDRQQDDGLWDAGGQLPGQKRPKLETRLVSTAWNALALGSVDAPTSAATRNRALAAIDKAADDGVSTEWDAVRLLLALQSDSPTDVERWTAKLRSTQRPDGGWGWIATDSSDAMATGQALYALSKAGLAPDDPVVDRAVRFLVTSQTDDGSWAVNGTKENSKSKTAETASYWGTCWAVLGLLSTIDDAQEVPAR